MQEPPRVAMLWPASPPESFFPPVRKDSRTPRGTAAPCSESSNRASLYSHAPRAQFHPCALRPVREPRRFVPLRTEFAAPFLDLRLSCVLCALPGPQTTARSYGLLLVSYI